MMSCHIVVLFNCVAEPPKITTHPKDLKNFIAKPASFRIQATGTGPLTYQWQWIRSEKVGNKDWQPCDAKWSGKGATLTIPIVQKSNEGSYRCVVSNHVGNVTSNSATLEVSNIYHNHCTEISNKCPLYDTDTCM